MDNLFFLVIAGTLGILVIVITTVLIQVKSSQRLLRQQRAMAEAEALHQEQLANAFIRSQEKERRRIGMDLHDEVGTALSALKMQWLSISGDHNPAAEQGKKLIDQVVANIRRISHDLSPFIKGAYGLREALNELGDSLHRSGRIQANIDTLVITEMDTLSDEVQLALYRILSELVQNTLKHAGASRLDIHFTRVVQGLEVGYSDDGLGLPQADAGGWAADMGRPMTRGMGFDNIESRLRLINGSSRLLTTTKGFSMQLFIPNT